MTDTQPYKGVTQKCGRRFKLKIKRNASVYNSTECIIQTHSLTTKENGKNKL
jgi:hypothetical protein